MNATQELHSHKHILTTTLGLPTVSLRRAFMGWDVMVVFPNNVLGITFYVFGTKKRAFKKGVAEGVEFLLHSYTTLDHTYFPDI